MIVLEKKKSVQFNSIGLTDVFKSQFGNVYMKIPVTTLGTCVKSIYTGEEETNVVNAVDIERGTFVCFRETDYVHPVNGRLVIGDDNCY